MSRKLDKTWVVTCTVTRRIEVVVSAPTEEDARKAAEECDYEDETEIETTDFQVDTITENE